MFNKFFEFLTWQLISFLEYNFFSLVPLQQNKADAAADKTRNKKCEVFGGSLTKGLSVHWSLIDDLWYPEKPFMSQQCLNKLTSDLCMEFMTASANGQIKAKSDRELEITVGAYFVEVFKSFLTFAWGCVKPDFGEKNFAGFKDKVGETFMTTFGSFKTEIESALSGDKAGKGTKKK